MRYILWEGMLGTDGCDANVGGFARFGECVVAGIEVFAFLEFVLEEIVAIGQFAVEAEEFLFFFAEGVDINFVSLVWIHLEMMSLDVLGVGGMSCECGVTVEVLRKMGGCL